MEAVIWSSSTNMIGLAAARVLGQRLGQRELGWPAGRGQLHQKVVPWPGALCTAIRPPALVTVVCTMARPSPVPSPAALVVKNGSKIRSCTAASMPQPVSRTVSTAKRAGVRPRIGLVGSSVRRHLQDAAARAAWPGAR